MYANKKPTYFYINWELYIESFVYMVIKKYLLNEKKRTTLPNPK